jgi:hypothetical protein
MRQTGLAEMDMVINDTREEPESCGFNDYGRSGRGFRGLPGGVYPGDTVTRYNYVRLSSAPFPDEQGIADNCPVIDFLRHD